MQPLSNSQAKCWVFTHNNYTAADIERYKFDLHPNQVFLRYGMEGGTPETPTPHLQGYICFSKRIKFSTVRNALPGCHIQKMKGTIADNDEYTGKTDPNPFERGTRPQENEAAMRRGAEGQSLLWSEARKRAHDGTMDEIADDKFYGQHFNTLRAMEKHLHKKPRVERTKPAIVMWFVGASGTGKSRTADELYPGAYRKDLDSFWRDFQWQDQVILEDLDISHTGMARNLKIWGDRYPFQIKVLYAGQDHILNVFIVTSQYGITDIWKDNATIDALQRRFRVFDFGQVITTEESSAEEKALSEKNRLEKKQEILEYVAEREKAWALEHALAQTESGDISE